MTQPPPPPQWQMPNALIPLPETFAKTATTLNKTLGWLRGLTLVQLGLFGLVWAGFLLMLLFNYQWVIDASGPRDTEFVKQAHWFLVALYAVTGALTLACYALGIKLLDWSREYLDMLRGVALGGGLQSPARLGALTQTFGKYITASQWAMPVLGVVLALFPMALIPTLIENKNNFGMGEAFIMGLIILFAFAPMCTINGLLLAAVRRWLNATSQRMRGRSVATYPSAQTLGNWLIFLLVLIGLGIVSSLPSLLTPFSLALPNLLGVRSGPTPMSTTTLIVLALAAFVLVAFQLAQQVITFLALLHSRTYAEQSALLLDAGPSAPSGDLPMNSGNPFEKVTSRQ